MINEYLEKAWEDKGGKLYIIPEGILYEKELKIFEILRHAYSKHPQINPNYGSKEISSNYLFRDIYQRKGVFRKINDGKNPQLTVKTLRFLIQKSRKDLLHLFANDEYNDFIRAVKDLNPWVVYLYSPNEKIISYFNKEEKYLKEWAKQVRSGLIPSPDKEYHPDFNKAEFRHIQTEILLRMWGYRDAMTGELVIDKSGNLLHKISRHHYKISDSDNKIECFISALVPLMDQSHGKAHTNEWESFFTKAVIYIQEGDFSELVNHLSTKWDTNNIKEYEKWLKKYGFI